MLRKCYCLVTPVDARTDTPKSEVPVTIALAVRACKNCDFKIKFKGMWLEGNEVHVALKDRVACTG